MNSLEQKIHALAEALRVAVNAADVAGILACWAPGGVLLPPHHPAVQGHAAIAEYFRRIFADRRLTFTFNESTITIIGEAAIERLTYSSLVTHRTSGQTAEDVGKGLHVYARQPNGEWKLVQDIWNSDWPQAHGARTE